MSIHVRGIGQLPHPTLLVNFAEAILRMLLVLATVAYRWESMEGDFKMDGQVLCTVVIGPVKTSSGVGIAAIDTAWS